MFERAITTAAASAALTTAGAWSTELFCRWTAYIDATPKTVQTYTRAIKRFLAYLNDIGFQAFIFFGVLVGCNAVWLYSDANDTKKDHKALPIDLSLFHTSKVYNWGALGIAIITIILYITLW